jgi:crotonobetainyl-CoA:carnitine CoA-transferase CaiB-like acyl-CoA transferase
MAEIVATLESAAVPCAPIYSPAEALQDPHINSGAFFAETSYSGFDNPINLVVSPVRFSTLESGVRHGAPRLGEHTDSILGDLGFTETEIEAMRASRTI